MAPVTTPMCSSRYCQKELFSCSSEKPNFFYMLSCRTVIHRTLLAPKRANLLSQSWPKRSLGAAAVAESFSDYRVHDHTWKPPISAYWICNSSTLIFRDAEHRQYTLLPESAQHLQGKRVKHSQKLDIAEDLTFLMISKKDKQRSMKCLKLCTCQCNWLGINSSHKKQLRLATKICQLWPFKVQARKG